MGTALVTGASSGLGQEFAWQLAAGRHNLVLVARRGDRLEDLARRLHDVAGVQAEVIVADLSDPDDLAVVEERVSVPKGDPQGRRPVDLLVNNAGFGLNQSFLDGDFTRELEALDVMVNAVMVLSHAAGLSMRERHRGAILNVASVAAETGAGTYSAHKAWVKAFTEGLAMELEGTGVTATAVSPGLTRTEFHEAAGKSEWEGPSWIWSDADEVVSAALQAVRTGRVLVTPTRRYKATGAIARHAPRAVVRTAVRYLPHM